MRKPLVISDDGLLPVIEKKIHGQTDKSEEVNKISQEAVDLPVEGDFTNEYRNVSQGQTSNKTYKT